MMTGKFIPRLCSSDQGRQLYGGRGTRSFEILLVVRKRVSPNNCYF